MASPASTAVLERIKASEHRLTIEFPPKRADYTPAGPAPTTPLTGVLLVPTLVPVAPTPVEPERVDIHCLWYDEPTERNTVLPQERRVFGLVGWREGASALALVAIADVADDPAKPYGPSILDRCSAVTHFGMRYQIQAHEPLSASNALPALRLVWLLGQKG